MTRVWEKIEHLKQLPDLEHRRFRHPSPARLPVAGLVRAGHDRGPGFGVSRHLQLPDRAAPGGGGDRHQCARIADGLFRPRRQTTRRWPRLPTRSWPIGRRITTATCASCCPTPTARPNFLQRAPDWVADWTGIRIDSGILIEGGEEAVAWWRARGQDPKREACDLLRWAGRGDDRAHSPAFPRPRADRLRLGHAADQRLSRAARRTAGSIRFSIVCKVISANGQPAVKLSDNPTKAMGPPAEIKRYKRVFQVGSQQAQPVFV